MATHDPARHSAHDAATHAHGAHGAHGAHAHDAHTSHVAPGADKRPAFMGLIIGGVALFAIMWGTVLLTNKQFEGHGSAGGAKGGQAGAAAPAAQAPAGH